MILQQFLEAYNGRYIDFDGYYGAQCMDLEHQYIVEVLGLTDPKILAAPSARDVYNNFATITGNQYFERVPNTPTGIPQEGDIIFWGNAPYGHVAVFIEGDANKFKSFDQNYPTGSPCHVQDHTYANVAGWLRFKGTLSIQQELDKVRIERDTHWNTIVAICEALGVAPNKDAAVAEAKKLVGLDDILVQKEKRIQELQSDIATVEAELAGKTAMLTAFSDKNKELEQQVVKLTEAVEESQKRIDSALSDNKALQESLKDLKERSSFQLPTGIRKFIINLLLKW